MGDEDDHGLVYDSDADGQHEVNCNHHSGGLVVCYGGMDLYCDNLEDGGESREDHVENLEGGDDANPCDEQMVGDAHHDGLEGHNVEELVLVLDGMVVHDEQVCDEQAHDAHEQVVGDAHHDDLEDHNVEQMVLVLDGMAVHDEQVFDEQAHDVHDEWAYDEQGHEYNHDEDLVGDES